MYQIAQRRISKELGNKLNKYLLSQFKEIHFI